MNIRFKTLFTLSVSHTYYSSGVCNDFDFVLAGETSRTLAGGRMVARTLDGTLHVLYEACEDGKALTPATNAVLRIGLRLTNPNFSCFTELPAVPDGCVPLYRNAASPNTLDGAAGARLVGRALRHSLTAVSRPAVVVLKEPSGCEVRRVNVTPLDGTDATFDLSGRAAGAYTVEESWPGGGNSTQYYADSELMGAGIFGIVEITLRDGFYASPPRFDIGFTAKRDILKYYLVAKDYNEDELAALFVKDTRDNAPDKLKFKRFRFDKPEPEYSSEDEFKSDTMHSLLEKPGAAVMLFRSEDLVPRREACLTSIQLEGKDKDNPLIKILPQLGTDRINGEIIINVSKPKGG